MSSSRLADRVEQSGVTGGVLAIAVSLGVFVSLPIRGVDYNVLNLFTIVLAAIAGMLAVRGSRRKDGAGLGWGTALLFVAVLPAVVGWVGLLYLPSLVLLVAAVVLYVRQP